MTLPPNHDTTDLRIHERVTFAGLEVSPDQPPAGLTHHADLGVITPDWVAVQRIHRWPTSAQYADTPRPIITAAGEIVMPIVAGPKHHAFTPPTQKVNDVYIYRSADRGKTWQGPTLATTIPHNQHGWSTFIPRGSTRIYAFGTEPAEGYFDEGENAAIGYRISDDNGRTWSEPTLIAPVNDPDFRGMSIMRVTETDRGTWLVGAHEANWYKRPIKTRQYILRSADQGQTWTVGPNARPDGWVWEPANRMDEGRPIALGDGRVLLMVRTCEGHLWEIRSEDDGQTWTEPQPTSLIHPDAPPMLFHLADGQTLVAFHHNRCTPGHFNHADRAELWVSLSHDQGRTWTEPRFVVANTAQPAGKGGQSGHMYDCNLSYADLLVDGSQLHLFIPHQFRQILQFSFTEDDLSRFPRKTDLEGQTINAV
jgi:hypothetical protein